VGSGTKLGGTVVALTFAEQVATDALELMDS
jgi:hypothetical protein